LIWCTCARGEQKHISTSGIVGKLVACTWGVKVHGRGDGLCFVSHDVDKFLLVDLAVLVEIKLIDHCL